MHGLWSIGGRLGPGFGQVGAGVCKGLLALLLASCGGGTGNEQDSGTNKTYLRVEAVDPDGDALEYQWRVTGGHIDNRNANEAVWTMPDGPGLHFAYVVVSDGRGGYVEQQYAVGTDALRTEVPARAPLTYQARQVSDPRGFARRLRFTSGDNTAFRPLGGTTRVKRQVYLPDLPVQVLRSDGTVVFSGLTDVSGEVDLPVLNDAESFQIKCATSADTPLVTCGSVPKDVLRAEVQPVPVTPPAERNLRLFGHLGLADGSVCGMQDEFFDLQRAATVQLLQADGTPVAPPRRVNRFGDYALDAAVGVRAPLKLKVQCDRLVQTFDLEAPPSPDGYVATQPVEFSRPLTNGRPRVVKMVANGPDGNVRGRMVVAEPGAVSNELPGGSQFLVYKGKDSRLGACMYYRALGAVGECDAQGNMKDAITLDDWKRRHHFAPYTAGNVEHAATYINKMDLNLVRRMIATKAADDSIAFYVCNHPGPEGSTQAEVDQVMATALADERQVACVAMEWSVSPGVNNDRPFTKFLTFGPDGALLPSVNLDGRGEKFMPGACVACHGGARYNGRFPEKGDPSPFLGSGFLAFDTGNYLFPSDPALSEEAQGSAIYELNQLVRATEAAADTPTSTLIANWYRDGTKKLDKNYVPTAWQQEVTPTNDAALFYREVIGSSCRTCHVSMGPTFNWDAIVLKPDIRNVATHVCGGTDDIASNASMPNALISRDRVSERVRANADLAGLMTKYLGCSVPLPDPVYPKR